MYTKTSTEHFSMLHFIVCLVVKLSIQRKGQGDKPRGLFSYYKSFSIRIT